jgi:hypothetical protein
MVYDMVMEVSDLFAPNAILLKRMTLVLIASNLGRDGPRCSHTAKAAMIGEFS